MTQEQAIQYALASEPAEMTVPKVRVGLHTGEPVKWCHYRAKKWEEAGGKSCEARASVAEGSGNRTITPYPTAYSPYFRNPLLARVPDGLSNVCPAPFAV